MIFSDLPLKQLRRSLHAEPMRRHGVHILKSRVLHTKGRGSGSPASRERKAQRRRAPDLVEPRGNPGRRRVAHWEKSSGAGAHLTRSRRRKLQAAARHGAQPREGSSREDWLVSGGSTAASALSATTRRRRDEQLVVLCPSCTSPRLC